MTAPEPVRYPPGYAPYVVPPDEPLDDEDRRLIREEACDD